MSTRVIQMGLPLSSYPDKEDSEFVPLVVGQPGAAKPGSAKLKIVTLKAFDPVSGVFVPLPGIPPNLKEETGNWTPINCTGSYSNGATGSVTSTVDCLEGVNPSYVEVDVKNYLVLSDSVDNILQAQPGHVSRTALHGSGGVVLPRQPFLSSFALVMPGEFCDGQEHTLPTYQAAVDELSIEYVHPESDYLAQAIDPRCPPPCGETVPVNLAYTLILEVDYDIEGTPAWRETSSGSWSGALDAPGEHGESFDGSFQTSELQLAKDLWCQPAYEVVTHNVVTSCSCDGSSSTYSAQTPRSYALSGDTRLSFQVVFVTKFKGQSFLTEEDIRKFITGYSSQGTGNYPVSSSSTESGPGSYYDVLDYGACDTVTQVYL